MKSVLSTVLLTASVTTVAFGSAIKQQARSDATVAAVGNIAVGPAPDGAFALTALYVCKDINFNGPCQNLQTQIGQCYDLGNGFNDAISSLGPDAGVTCTLHDNPGCSGDYLGGIVRPGIYNLGDYGWNDRASAYRCI